MLRGILTICLLAGLLLPGTARAIYCPATQPAQCGSEIDDSTGTQFNIDFTSCMAAMNTLGAEAAFIFVLSQPAEVTATLVPETGFDGWDAVLYILPVGGGDCDPTNCIVGADYGFSGQPEEVTTTLDPGTYYIVVDGYMPSDYGDFHLSVGCVFSSVCQADLTIDCGDNASADTATGRDNVDFYCGAQQPDYSSREYIFQVTADQSGAIEFQTDAPDGLELDAFVIARYATGDQCDPGTCLDHSQAAEGDEQLVFYAEAGQSYYISVDGPAGQEGAFDYSVVCRSESCSSDADLLCGEQIAGDTTQGANSMSAYPGIDHHLLANEYTYHFTAPADLEATVTMDIDVGGGQAPDLALLALEGACSPDSLLAHSDLVQDAANNPPEVVTFTASAGSEYFLVVDGWEAQAAGTYSLQIDCLMNCGTDLTQCGFDCVDLDSDPAHCGSCDNPCSYANAEALCAAGSCGMGACLADWADCNQDDSDGCETPLGTIENCSDCDDACGFPHASADCQDNVCLLGTCEAGWGDCNTDSLDGCETVLNVPETCGSCDTACPAGEACYQGECVLQCPDGLQNCSGACVDTASDPYHCGGCDQVCQLDSASSVCQTGACLIDTCDDGFADCNSDPSDGCEAQLGTPQACGACDDACEYVHAAGACQDQICVMGQCDLGWGNCNDLDDDGCESELRADNDNCGSCGNACEDHYTCEYGNCMPYCEDLDEDGHEHLDCGGDDCDDNDAGAYPGAEEICGDGIDQDCDGEDPECVCSDEDGDGHLDAACGGDDCNDANGFIHPGAQEACSDGVDQDCDGADLICDCPDGDQDGHQSAACGGDDCDDGNHFVYPMAPEACGDGIDQDCDGVDAECDTGCGCATGGASRLTSLLVLLIGLAIGFLGATRPARRSRRRRRLCRRF